MPTVGVVLLSLVATVLYGVGAGRAWRGLRSGVVMGRGIWALALVGTAAQAGALLWRWVTAGRVTFAGGAAGSLGLFALCVGAAYLLLGLRHRGPWWAALLLPIAALASLLAGLGVGAGWVGGSFAASWGIVHVVPTVAGIACLVAAAALCVTYLVEEWYLRTRRLGATLRWLPALEALDRLSGWVLGLAFALLSVGLASGAVRALLWKELGGNWPLDPKVISSVVTWSFVGGVVAARRRGAFGGRQRAYLVLLAAALAAFTYLGVDALLRGRHASL